MNWKIILNEIQNFDFLIHQEKQLMKEENFLKNLSRLIIKIAGNDILQSREKLKNILDCLTKRYRKMLSYQVKEIHKGNSLFSRLLSELINDKFKRFDWNLEKIKIRKKMRKQRGKNY